MSYKNNNNNNKRNPDSIPNISKLKKDIIKLISGNDSIIILLSHGTLIIHDWSRVTAQKSI